MKLPAMHTKSSRRRLLLPAILLLMCVGDVALAKPGSDAQDKALAEQVCGTWVLVSSASGTYVRKPDASKQTPRSYYQDKTGDAGYGDQYLVPYKVVNQVMYFKIKKPVMWVSAFKILEISGNSMKAKVNLFTNTYTRTKPCQAKSSTTQAKGFPDLPKDRW